MLIITHLGLLVIGFFAGAIWEIRKTIKKLDRFTPPPCDFGQEDERVGANAK